MASFNIVFSDESNFTVGFGEDAGFFNAAFDSVIANDKYHGEYEFTPSSQSQTIATAGLVLSENITIDPIPSNYGLITWNGSTLTVS
jgi:hypothetical protein